MPAPAAAISRSLVEKEEELCDVLPEKEYFAEVTEILLTAAPSMTAEQIVPARRRLVEFAIQHGWAEK